jgi:hypothetical protein
MVAVKHQVSSCIKKLTSDVRCDAVDLASPSVMSFVYPLPTTGSVPFSTLVTDAGGTNAHHLATATATRGRLRAVLKEDRRREEGQRDPAAATKVCLAPCSTGMWPLLDSGEAVPMA